MEAFAFHNPGCVNDYLVFDADEIARSRERVREERQRERYEYISDSNGYWRFRSLLDVLEDPAVERVHVVTHPEWWQPESAVAARPRRTGASKAEPQARSPKYDDDLRRAERENIR